MKKTALITMLSGACALTLGAGAAAKTDDAAEVRATVDQAFAEFTACDTNAIGKYDANMHTGYYPDSAALVDETSDENRKMAADFCNNGGKHDMKYDIADIVMLKDAALVLGSGHYMRTEPNGAVSIDTDFTFTDVMVKTKDGWKFRHTHIGVVLPANEGAASE